MLCVGKNAIYRCSVCHQSNHVLAFFCFCCFELQCDGSTCEHTHTHYNIYCCGLYWLWVTWCWFFGLFMSAAIAALATSTVQCQWIGTLHHLFLMNRYCSKSVQGFIRLDFSRCIPTNGFFIVLYYSGHLTSITLENAVMAFYAHSLAWSLAGWQHAVMCKYSCA